MSRRAPIADLSSPDITPNSSVSAVVLTSFLFHPEPPQFCLLPFVDSCRKFLKGSAAKSFLSTATPTWRAKCAAGMLTDHEVRAVVAAAFESVIHAFLVGPRPDYPFAVRIAPETLWSVTGPNLKVESFGPEIDHSLMDDLMSLLSVCKQLARSE